MSVNSYVIDVITDLGVENLRPITIGNPIQSGDIRAHSVRVALFRDGAKFNPANGASVKGYFQCPENSTPFSVNGTITGNVCEVDFPSNAYDHSGKIVGIVRLIESGSVTTIGKVFAYVTDDVNQSGSQVETTRWTISQVENYLDQLVTYVNNQTALTNSVTNHINNSSIHITADERNTWSRAARQADALMKIAEGQMYDFESDDDVGDKVVPSGAKAANVVSIGGRSIVMNQMIPTDKNNPRTIETSNSEVIGICTLSVVKDHVYLASVDQSVTMTSNTRNTFVFVNQSTGNRNYESGLENNNLGKGRHAYKFTATDTISNLSIQYWCHSPSVQTTLSNWMFFDLTLMGIPDITISEFNSVFRNSYYAYNSGSIVSSKVDNVTVSGANLQIPQALINACPDYGLSAGSAYNWIDFENKVYHHNVKMIDMGDYNWGINPRINESNEENKQKVRFTLQDNSFIKPSTGSNNKPNILSELSPSLGFYDIWVYTRGNDDGISVSSGGYISIVSSLYPDLTEEQSNNTTYKNNLAKQFKNDMKGRKIIVELVDEELIDLSANLDDRFDVISVEAGGSIKFVDSDSDLYDIPVPNSIQYLVKLSEV